MIKTFTEEDKETFITMAADIQLLADKFTHDQIKELIDLAFVFDKLAKKEYLGKTIELGDFAAEFYEFIKDPAK